MSKKIFLSQLPAGITTDAIREFLASCGEVKDLVLSQAEANAYVVTMADAEAARRAVAEKNQALLNGQAVLVSEVQNLANMRVR